MMVCAILLLVMWRGYTKNKVQIITENTFLVFLIALSVFEGDILISRQ
jgi:hypothetical protein